MAEKRRRSRMAVHAGVVLHSVDKAFFLTGQIRDISLNSLYIKSEASFPLGTKCHIDIIIPAKHSKMLIQLIGKVVRREQAGYGVEFDHDLEFWPMLAMLKP
ncbi:MAG: PilZ domain-containing protein [Proteobacteria bacterium]|nr:PilZ domain-containing protein [Pseudomonadota bacterium]MBU1739547.1 PilZ domain-containing protein [Pseudomonadota bacterium]